MPSSSAPERKEANEEDFRQQDRDLRPSDGSHAGMKNDQLGKPQEMLGPSSVLPRKTTADEDSSSPQDRDPGKKEPFWKPFDSWRANKDEKVVGLKTTALSRSTREKRQRLMVGSNHSRRSVTSQRRVQKDGVSGRKLSIEEMEEEAHAKELKNPFILLFLGNVAAVKVMIFYMSKFDTSTW